MRKGIQTTHDSSRPLRKSRGPCIAAAGVLLLGFLLVPTFQDSCDSGDTNMVPGGESSAGDNRSIMLAQLSPQAQYQEGLDPDCVRKCGMQQFARGPAGMSVAEMQRCVSRCGTRPMPEPKKTKKKKKHRFAEKGCPEGTADTACRGGVVMCYKNVKDAKRDEYTGHRDDDKPGLFVASHGNRCKEDDEKKDTRRTPRDTAGKDSKDKDDKDKDRKRQAKDRKDDRKRERADSKPIDTKTVKDILKQLVGGSKPQDQGRGGTRPGRGGSKPIDAQTVMNILKEVLGGGKDKGRQTAHGGPAGGGGMPPSGGQGPGGSGSPVGPGGGRQPQPGSRGPGGAGTPAESTGDDTPSSGPATTGAAPPAGATGGHDDSEEGRTSPGSGPTPKELLDSAPGHKPIYTASQRDTTGPSEESGPAGGEEPGSSPQESNSGRPDTERGVPGSDDQPSTVGTGSNLLDTLIREVAPPVYGSSPDVEQTSNEVKTGEGKDGTKNPSDGRDGKVEPDDGYGPDPTSMSIKQIMQELRPNRSELERQFDNFYESRRLRDDCEHVAEDARKQGDWKDYNEWVQRANECKQYMHSAKKAILANWHRRKQLRKEFKAYREGKRGSEPRPTARGMLEGVRDDGRGVGPGIFR